jgi:hypothetical protein
MNPAFPEAMIVSLNQNVNLRSCAGGIWWYMHIGPILETNQLAAQTVQNQVWIDSFHVKDLTEFNGTAGTRMPARFVLLIFRYLLRVSNFLQAKKTCPPQIGY